MEPTAPLLLRSKAPRSILDSIARLEGAHR